MGGIVAELVCQICKTRSNGFLTSFDQGKHINTGDQETRQRETMSNLGTELFKFEHSTQKRGSKHHVAQSCTISQMPSVSESWLTLVACVSSCITFLRVILR